MRTLIISAILAVLLAVVTSQTFATPVGLTMPAKQTGTVTVSLPVKAVAEPSVEESARVHKDLVAAIAAGNGAQIASLQERVRQMEAKKPAPRGVSAKELRKALEESENSMKEYTDSTATTAADAAEGRANEYTDATATTAANNAETRAKKYADTEDAAMVKELMKRIASVDFKANLAIFLSIIMILAIIGKVVIERRRAAVPPTPPKKP
ncbi:MAG: hypothetical protein WCG48_00830 [Candidatus Berkelbacteria bacterium]